MRALKLLLHLALATLAVLALARPAPAQVIGGEAYPPGAPPMPVCNALRDGIAACLGGRQCVCGFERGGSLSGQPDRWRWDCGILRPSCQPAPADLAPRQPLPPILPQIVLPGQGGTPSLPERPAWR
ncbi:hypothetical protein M0638_09550 [Roseomonas sp. NAR14]|uniref:Secreted protein n=1 Tax=Roseomonas acroporae TaxID=2937791 RepID=A0A9X1Y6X0_9PROT|nr:hypothetical protein [Roseomonas acroporae]MCK8784626.1 hypothetical protein [Roseomonas acroporae]